MDSPNSMLEYDQRIPDKGGELFWEIVTPSDGLFIAAPTLPPGNYRFEPCGGNGGRGGNGGNGGLVLCKAGMAVKGSR